MDGLSFMAWDLRGSPGIFLTPEGGEKDGRKNLHRKRNRRM